MNTAANKYMSMEVGVAGQKGVVVLTSRHEIVEDVDIVAVVDCSLSMEGPKLDMVQMTLHALVEAATATSRPASRNPSARIIGTPLLVRWPLDAIGRLRPSRSTFWRPRSGESGVPALDTCPGGTSWPSPAPSDSTSRVSAAK